MMTSIVITATNLRYKALLSKPLSQGVEKGRVYLPPLSISSFSLLHTCILPREYLLNDADEEPMCGNLLAPYRIIFLLFLFLKALSSVVMTMMMKRIVITTNKLQNIVLLS